VLVLVRYRVTSKDGPAFLGLLYALSGDRRRDGAYAWGVCEDAADPERILEWFVVDSWAEHLRQNKRVSNADAELQQEAIRFHTGPGPPKVQHLLSVRPPAVTTPR
jgi:hypothetical protein